MGSPRVAILIVTYNAAPFIRQLLASLREHTDLDRVPVIVVDNASNDGTMAALAEEAARMPGLELLPQATNSGFTGGNNIGLSRARSLGVEFVLLLNPDTVVTAGWLEPLLAVMQARPEVAAAQPLLLLWDHPERVNSAGNHIHFCGFGYCDGYDASAKDIAIPDEAHPITYATGAALLLRMSALDEVGDFDELLFLYHDDLELQLRLRQRGYECVLVPAARVYHKYKADFSPAKFGWLERNRWMVLIKDWPASVLLLCGPALAGVEAAVLLAAVRQGWLPEKLRGYREVFHHIPALLRARRAQSRVRTHSVTDHMTARLEGYGGAAWTVRIGNPILETYWAVVRRVIRA
jgi:GT2 family glycosyltransferase